MDWHLSLTGFYDRQIRNPGDGVQYCFVSLSNPKFFINNLEFNYTKRKIGNS